ncbi:MAG: hypothetical protein ACI9NC_005894 [Verrucomicrobiales bacterium]|jgi:hypothetical protein
MQKRLKKIYRNSVPNALAGPINSIYRKFNNPNPKVPIHEAQILDELKAFFVHLPRTGGTSVEQVLRPLTQKDPLFGHTTAAEFQMMFPEQWKQYYSFAFVRNPWDRLASTFFYVQRSHRNSFFVKNFVLPHRDDLSAFVVNILKENPTAAFMMEHFRPQFTYVCNPDRSIAVDFVGRFEQINEDWKVIAEKLGIDTPLPHTNHSTRDHYSKHFTNEAAEAVAQVYREDIELFDYKY